MPLFIDISQPYHTLLIADNKDDIISFVENVILGGNDPMEVLRKEFTEKVIKFNYPHASEAILDDLKTALGRRE